MENKSFIDLGILNDSVIKIDITKGKQIIIKFIARIIINRIFIFTFDLGIILNERKYFLIIPRIWIIEISIDVNDGKMYWWDFYWSRWTLSTFKSNIKRKNKVNIREKNIRISIEPIREFLKFTIVIRKNYIR